MSRDANDTSRCSTSRDGWADRVMDSLPAGLPRALLAAVADASAPVMLVDRASTRLLYANGAAHGLLGYPEGGLAAMRLDQLASARPESLQALSALADRPSGPGDRGREMTLPFRHSSGGELNIPWLVTLLAEDGIVVLVGQTQESPAANAVSRDPLTGLADRLALEARMKQIRQARGAASEPSFALLFLDLDDFKRVNDVHGHLVGDRLLGALARRLEAAIRPGDLAARYGGDEFVVVLEDVGDAESAGRIAARLGDELRKPIALEGREFSISASTGIVLGRAGEVDLGGLLRAADAAMYRAKSLGSGEHVIFDEKACPLTRSERSP